MKCLSHPSYQSWVASDPEVVPVTSSAGPSPSHARTAAREAHLATAPFSPASPIPHTPSTTFHPSLGHQVLQGPPLSSHIPGYLEALRAKPSSHLRNAIFCICWSALTGLKQHHFQRYHGDGCLINACNGDAHGQQSPARQRWLWPVPIWHGCPSPPPALPPAAKEPNPSS